MSVVLRVGSWIFMLAAGALVVAIRSPRPVISESSEYILIGVSVVTLPAALGQVIKQGDARSRRNWAIFLGIVVVLAALSWMLL